MTMRASDPTARAWSRRELLLTGGAAAVATALGAPRATAQTSSPPATASGQLAIATTADLDTFDPHISLNAPNRGAVRTVFETLVTREEQPLLATAWEQPNDRTWLLKLRPGVTFHNGDRFNGEAAKFSLDRFMDSGTKSPFAATLKPIEQVAVVDDLTIRIQTSEPFGNLLEALAEVEMLSPGAVRAAGADVGKKPVGTGPFRLKAWALSEQVVLEAFPGYWGAKPRVATVVYRPIPEASTRVVALRTGEVDIIVGVPPEMVRDVTGNGLSPKRVPAKSVIKIALNLTAPPFSDRRVRQAANHAINRDEIIKVLLDGAGTPANGPLSPMHAGYDPGLPGYAYDPERARALIAQAGATKAKVTLNVTRGRFAKDAQVAEAVAHQLGEVGLDASVNVMEYTAWLKAYRTAGEGFQIPANSATSQRQFTAYFDSRAKAFGWWGYDNPEVNGLIDRARRTPKREDRAKIYAQLSRIIRDDAPWIFLYNEQLVYGVRDRVRDWVPRGDELIMTGGAWVTG